MTGPSAKDIEWLHRNGVPAEEVDKLREQHLPEICVDEVETQACRLFARVQSQWQRDSMAGVLTSLDYQGVETVARILKIDLDDELFGCIQIMENEVLQESTRRARNSRPKR